MGRRLRPLALVLVLVLAACSGNSIGGTVALFMVPTPIRVSLCVLDTCWSEDGAALADTSPDAGATPAAVPRLPAQTILAAASPQQTVLPAGPAPIILAAAPAQAIPAGDPVQAVLRVARVRTVVDEFPVPTIFAAAATEPVVARRAVFVTAPSMFHRILPSALDSVVLAALGGGHDCRAGADSECFDSASATRGGLMPAVFLSTAIAAEGREFRPAFPDSGEAMRSLGRSASGPGE